MNDDAHGSGTATVAVEVRSLTVGWPGRPPIVAEVDLDVPPGGVLAIVGESGSGKSTTARALLGYVRPGAGRLSGSVTVFGKKAVQASGVTPGVRGEVLAYVPQDPATCLDPCMRVGKALREVLHVHGKDESASERIQQVLKLVQLPSGTELLRRYPHELSGGQQQRIVIALALVCAPPVLVLDEPTTGLDVVTKEAFIAELARLREELGTTIVYVTHDFGVVARLADSVAVMYGGRIVEEGPTEDLLRMPLHPYTRGLVSSIPDVMIRHRLEPLRGVAVAPHERGLGCAFAPRCDQSVATCFVQLPQLEATTTERRRKVRCTEFAWTPALQVVPEAISTPSSPPTGSALRVEHLSATYGHQRKQVVFDVSFEAVAGECLAVVGESGSGKTTVARCIAGLHTEYSGQMFASNELLAPAAQRRTKVQRREIQLIFQNPYDSLNPRLTVRTCITRPMRLLCGLSKQEAGSRANELLDIVRLPRAMADKHPVELSGGERQRVAIARAIGPDPAILICDEITSSLDVSVQAAILELLRELASESKRCLLLIAHDFGVVTNLADRIIVLRNGEVRETGALAEVLNDPRAEYTQQLVSAAMALAPPRPTVPQRTS